MTNVTKFPTKEVKAASLYQRLTDLTDSLEVKYSELDALHADLHTSELTATELETELDILLKQYVPLVGIESGVSSIDKRALQTETDPQKVLKMISLLSAEEPSKCQ